MHSSESTSKGSPEVSASNFAAEKGASRCLNPHALYPFIPSYPISLSMQCQGHKQGNLEGLTPNSILVYRHNV